MFRKFFVFLFALSLLIFLPTTNIRLASSSPHLYNYCFNAFNVPEKLNLSPQQVKEIGKGLIRFFNLPDVRVEEIEPYPGFFNERERVHLQDIKNLIQLNNALWKVSGSALILFLLVLLFTKPRLFPKTLTWVGLFILGIFLVLLPFLFFSFDRLFLAFHEVAFPNTYWMLDPERDKLILIFPPEFFYRAAIMISLGVVVEALALSGLSWLIPRMWSSLKASMMSS